VVVVVVAAAVCSRLKGVQQDREESEEKRQVRDHPVEIVPRAK